MGKGVADTDEVRRDEVLRRMLTTPPSKPAAKPKKEKPAAKQPPRPSVKDRGC